MPLATLALAGALAALSASAIHSAAPPPPPATTFLLHAAPVDTLVDVGGHRLHLVVRQGTAPLTILLEAGGGADAGSWATVPDSLAARTDATVVAYDRSGFGRSDLGAPDLTPREEVAALRRALATLSAPPRTLLVGHSYGAMMALLHASLHPAAVAGVVLVDPMNPRFVEATGEFVSSTVREPAAPATDRERALVRLIRGFPALVTDVAAAEPDLQHPITILTAGEGWWDEQQGAKGMDAAWRASHEAMAAVPGRRLVVVERTRHGMATSRPDAIVDAVVELIP